MKATFSHNKNSNKYYVEIFVTHQEKNSKCWWGYKLVWPCGNQHGSSQNMEIDLPCDPDIPLLDIYPKDSKSTYDRYLLAPHCFLQN